MRKLTAFTISELMAVVTIIGLLTVIVFPSYRDYSLRAETSKAYFLLRTLSDAIVDEFEKTDVLPTTINFAGLSLNAGTWLAFTNDKIVAIRYDISNQRISVKAKVTGLSGIDANYLDPITNPLTSEQLSGVEIVTILETGVYQSYCGTKSASDTSLVPASFIPSNCTCSDLNSVFTLGDISSCTS